MFTSSSLLFCLLHGIRLFRHYDVVLNLLRKLRNLVYRNIGSETLTSFYHQPLEIRFIPNPNKQ